MQKCRSVGYLLLHEFYLLLLTAGCLGSKWGWKSEPLKDKDKDDGGKSASISAQKLSTAKRKDDKQLIWSRMSSARKANLLKTSYSKFTNNGKCMEK